tara:strand:- start:264 stop:545 length:282 start_codon:yes stop_codon:yes gene_type:complete
MTRARDLADMISSGKIEIGEIATATQSQLGNTDLYGFSKLADGTLQLTYTNGADDISVSNNNGTQSDLYAESFFSKKGLTFSVDSNGNLNVTV